MAALWPTYITKVGIYFNSPIGGKTEKETAEKLASEYGMISQNVTTTPPAGINFISTSVSTLPMQTAIEKCLMDIKDSGGAPKLGHFFKWASEVSKFWLATPFQAIVPDPLHLASTTGAPGVTIPISNVVLNGGVIPALQADLLTAFSDGVQTIPYGIPMATKLAKAFTTHLTTVSGIHAMGVVSGTTLSPIPIPSLPIPWVGLV